MCFCKDFECMIQLFLKRKLVIAIVMIAGQYYTDDQWMNIYTFSMLYQWIHNSYQILMNIDTLSTEGLDDDDICIDAELKLYRSQAQAIGSGSRSSWLSRSTSMGMSVSPTPSSSSPTPEVCKL